MNLVGDSPSEPDFTHLDERGRLRMVDVTEKPVTRREARASSRVETTLDRDTLATTVTPDVIINARLIGLQTAKRTADIIPLCHPLALTKIEVTIDPLDQGFAITADVTCSGRTGVEMEALSACGFAALALIDALGARANARLCDLVLESKRGGVSGEWGREIPPPSPRENDRDDQA